MSTHCLAVIYAMVDGKDTPDCSQFRPQYRHGVEGVFAVEQRLSWGGSTDV
jgi:hypothetical protein